MTHLVLIADSLDELANIVEGKKMQSLALLAALATVGVFPGVRGPVKSAVKSVGDKAAHVRSMVKRSSIIDPMFRPSSIPDDAVLRALRRKALKKLKSADTEVRTARLEGGAVDYLVLLDGLLNKDQRAYDRVNNMSPSEREALFTP